jgi:hypothetical protein
VWLLQTRRKSFLSRGKSVPGPGPVTALTLLFCAVSALPVLADEHFSVPGQLSFTTDDNVNRTFGHGTPQYSDTFATVSAGTSFDFPYSHNSRFTLHPYVGADVYSKFSGLSRSYIGARGRFQYRRNGGFGVPIYSLVTTMEYRKFQSSMRTGYRVASGASVSKRFTTRISSFAALTYDYYSSDSAVFDTIDYSLRGHLDYALARHQILYLNLDFRQGDIVATADPSTAWGSLAASSAQTIQNDDVFTGLAAYRLDASTGIFTIGYNFMLNENNSIDLSARAIRSNSKGGFQYATNQVSLAWLWRL